MRTNCWKKKDYILLYSSHSSLLNVNSLSSRKQFSELGNLMHRAIFKWRVFYQWNHELTRDSRVTRGGGDNFTPCWLSLNNSKTVKAVWHYAAFRNIPLGKSMPSLAYLTRPSLQMFGKAQTGVIRFPDFWSIHVKENWRKSRTSDVTDMKLGPVNW